MAVGRNDIRDFMEKQPNDECSLAEIIIGLQGGIPDAEAAELYRNNMKGYAANSSLAHQVRCGRRHKIGRIVGELLGCGWLLRVPGRFLRGGKVRYRKNPDCPTKERGRQQQQKAKSKDGGTGVHRSEIRNWIRAQNREITVGEVCDHFRSLVDAQVLLDVFGRQQHGGKGKLARDLTRKEKIEWALQHVVSNCCSSLGRQPGWDYVLARISMNVVVPPSVASKEKSK